MNDADCESGDRDPVSAEIERASIMMGLPLTTVLDAAACSDIADAFGFDEQEIQLIHRRLCYARAHQDFGWIFAPTDVVQSLRTIADRLADLAAEFNFGNEILRDLLEVALCCSGETQEHPLVRTIMRGLARYPDRAQAGSCDQSSSQFSYDQGKFFSSCVQRYSESAIANFPLAVIETLQEGVEQLLELVPEKSRGSPGNSYRRAVICELASAYEEIFGEAPTCSGEGRFMQLCEHVFEAVGLSDAGFETAVGRVLRSRKAKTAS
jgi:hypothetical protein